VKSACGLPVLNVVFWCTLCLCLTVNLGIFLIAQDNQVTNNATIRNWTSADGKFQFKGELIGVEGSNVELKSAEGKRVTVPKSKLSKVDRKFIEEELSRRANENSTAGTTPSDPANPFAKKAEKKPNEGIRYVVLKSDSPLNLEREIWAPQKTIQMEPVKVIQPAKVLTKSAIENVTNTWFCLSVYSLGGYDPEKPESTNHERFDKKIWKSWVHLIKIPTGEVTGPFKLSHMGAQATDIDSSGKRLLAVEGTSEFSYDKVNLFEVAESELKLKQTIAIPNSDNSFDNIGLASFLAGEEMIVLSAGRQLIVWHLEKNQIVHRIKIYSDPLAHLRSDGTPGFVLANDRRHALIKSDGRRYEVDLIEGKCIGAETGVVTDFAGINKEIKSPDGSKILKFGHNMLIVKDSKGEIIDEFYAPIYVSKEKVVWLDESTIRLESANSEVYFDLKKRVVFLQCYRETNREQVGRWLVERSEAKLTNKEVNNRYGSAHFIKPFRVTSIPRPDINEFRKQLPEDPNDLLILKPGDRIKVVVEMEATPEKINTSKQKIEEILKTRGVTIDNGAHDIFRISSHRVPRDYYGRNLSTGELYEEPVKVNDTLYRFEFIRNEEVQWNHEITRGKTYQVDVRVGESIQAAVDRVVKQESASFVFSITFPKHVARHPKARPWFYVNPEIINESEKAKEKDVVPKARK
jgi:SLA1 homology domain 1, SHD1